MGSIRKGWRLARQQSFAACALFFFHLIWGTLFFRFVHGRVVEVMSRFPPQQLGHERTNLFLNEAILLLQKTDLAEPTLWVLLVFVMIRLLLSPALYAGVYNSLIDDRSPRGTTFIRGFKQFGGSFTWLYLLRLALTAVPLIWAIPALNRSFDAANSWRDLLFALAPWLLGITLFGALLKLLFTYLQMALVADWRIWPTLRFAVRKLPAISGLALIVFGIGACMTIAVYAASVYWAGLLALVLYLGWPLAQIWCKIWGVAVQYKYWSAS